MIIRAGFSHQQQFAAIEKRLLTGQNLFSRERKTELRHFSILPPYSTTKWT
jgi:hypothetical protein